MPTASGPPRLNLRLPAELHAALKAEAKREGVSLNTLIVSLLADGVDIPRSQVLTTISRSKR